MELGVSKYRHVGPVKGNALLARHPFGSATLPFQLHSDALGPRPIPVGPQSKSLQGIHHLVTDLECGGFTFLNCSV
jgi:hypothetical protein